MANDLGLGIVLTLKDLFSSKARQVTNSMKGMKKDADGTVGSFDKMNQALQGAAGAAVFVKAKQVLGGMITPALNFQEALAHVNSRITESGVNIEEVGKKLKSVGATFGVSTITQAEQLTELLDGGFANIGDALDILPLQNKLAQASLSDLGTAGKTLVDVFNAFQPEMSEMPRIANQLHILGKAGSGSFNFLAGGLQRILPQASNLGVKFEDLASIMMAMNESGVSQKNAIGALTAVMDAMSTDTEELDKIMKKNGLTSVKNAIATVGLSNTLVGLMRVTDGNLDKWAELGFSGQVLKSLMSGLDKEGRKLSDAFNTLSTDTENMNVTHKKVTESLAYRWRQVNVQWENTKITLGEKLLPLLAPLAEKMVVWGEQLAAFVEKHPKFASAVAIGIAVISALGVALGAVAVVAGVFAVIFSPIGLVVLKIAVVVGVLVGAFILLRKAVLSFLASNQGTVEKVKAAWSSVKSFLSDLWLVFSTAIAPILKEVGELAAGVFNDTFVAPLKAVVSVVETVYGWFVKLNEKISEFLNRFEIFRQANQSIKDFFSQDIKWPSFGQSVRNRAAEIRREQAPTQVWKNMQLSTGSNPGISGQQGAPNFSPVINVPQSKIVPGQIMIDKKKIGEVFFEMQQLATARGI